MKRKKTSKKMYVTRFYVMASSIKDAIKQIKNKEPDEVWIDEEWKSGQHKMLADAIGFHEVNNVYEEEE